MFRGLLDFFLLDVFGHYPFDESSSPSRFHRCYPIWLIVILSEKHARPVFLFFFEVEMFSRIRFFLPLLFSSVGVEQLIDLFLLDDKNERGGPRSPEEQVVLDPFQEETFLSVAFCRSQTEMNEKS